MDYSRLLGFSVLWFLVASALAGAALSRLTRRSPRRGPDSRPDTTAKWVLICVYLTAAVVSATVGLLAPSARAYLNGRTLLMCAAAVVVAFAACRFPRSVGAPALVLAAAAVVLGASFFRSIVAFAGETEIARVKVLSRKDARMTLELTPAGAPPVTVEMEGDYFAPIVRVVIFEDAFVFLGAKTWYRFDGLTSFSLERRDGGTGFRQAGTDYTLERPPGLSDGLYRLFEQWEGSIPGVRTVQVEMDLKRVEGSSPDRALEAFSVRLQNDGGVQVVRLP